MRCKKNQLPDGHLLGRLLVTRQQQLDFQEGFKWNELVHRKPGAVDWPNPNLDVAYSEAWVAVDESSCTIIDVPKIECVILETPVPDVPFGVRGVGEVPIVPPAACIANAIARATGVRLTRMPMTPERVFRALQEAGLR